MSYKKLRVWQGAMEIAVELGYFKQDVCKRLLQQQQKVNFQLHHLKNKVALKAQPT